MAPWTYLGLATSSSEHYVANRKGNVLKVRSVCRVVEASRWSPNAVKDIAGTPSKLCPLGDEDISPGIANSSLPYASLDSEDMAAAEGEVDTGEDSQNAQLRRQVPITDRDLRKYGFTDGCARCFDLKRGLKRSYKRYNHSDECRLRIYLAWKENGDQKYEKVKHTIEPDNVDNAIGQVDLDELVHDRAVLDPDDRPVRASPDRDVPTPVGTCVPLTPPQRSWDSPQHHALPDIQLEPSRRWDPEAHNGNPEDGDAYGDILEFFPHGSLNDDDEMEESAEDSAMVDYLVLVGAEPIEAKDRVNSMRGRRSTTFMEVYGGGAINECANIARRERGLKGIGALDIRTTKPDGPPWDFTKRADRRLASELIDSQNPDWLIGSPPCMAFSIWNFAMNYTNMDKAKVQAAIAEGQTNLNFVAKLYRKQMDKASTSCTNIRPPPFHGRKTASLPLPMVLPCTLWLPISVRTASRHQ